MTDESWSSPDWARLFLVPTFQTHKRSGWTELSVRAGKDLGSAVSHLVWSLPHETTGDLSYLPLLSLSSSTSNRDDRRDVPWRVA